MRGTYRPIGMLRGSARQEQIRAKVPGGASGRALGTAPWAGAGKRVEAASCRGDAIRFSVEGDGPALTDLVRVHAAVAEFLRSATARAFRSVMDVGGTRHFRRASQWHEGLKRCHRTGRDQSSVRSSGWRAAVDAGGFGGSSRRTGARGCGGTGGGRRDEAGWRRILRRGKWRGSVERCLAGPKACVRVPLGLSKRVRLPSRIEATLKHDYHETDQDRRPRRHGRRNARQRFLPAAADRSGSGLSAGSDVQLGQVS